MSLVKDHRKVALIVASGPSAAIMRTQRVDKRRIAVIGVNGALDWMPFLDYWFTLDPSKVNRKRMRTYRHNAKYYIAFPKNKILIPSYVTRLDRHSPVYDPADEGKFGKSGCAIGLNTTPNTINTGNSAFGALGLAYQLGFETVGLIGVDANGAMRLDGGYSRDLSHLPELFESAMHQIDLVNLGDMNSKIPTMSFEEFHAGVPHLSSKIVSVHGLNAARREQEVRLKIYERRRLRAPAPTIDVLTDIETPPILTGHDSTRIPPPAVAGNNLVLHQNVDVRAESPGTHLHLPFLTTAL
jgi:hypothetical protein